MISVIYFSGEKAVEKAVGRPQAKGKGRRGNPRGSGGQILKCHECDSTDHLVKGCPAKGNRKGRSTEVHLGSSEPSVEYLSLQDFEAVEHIFFTRASSMDNLDELEACGRRLYAYYLEYLR
eukprot:5630778-Pyramimonas_sp.AAC.1